MQLVVCGICVVCVTGSSLHFLFHYRVLVQTREICSSALHISSLQYHSAQELLVCPTLQHRLPTFQEDCVQDVRYKSSFTAIIQPFITFLYGFALNHEWGCSANTQYLATSSHAGNAALSV